MKTWMLAFTVMAFGFCSDGSPIDPLPPAPKPSPTAVGAPTGAPASSAIIGPEGGTLASADGRILVTVPAGAVTAPTTVSVQPIQNHAHGGLSGAYRLSPHGVTFAQPVRLTFRYSEADMAGTAPQLLRVAYQDERGYWKMYRRPEIDPSARTVSVQTRHFSDWSLVAGAQLLPTSATVRVGNTVALQVKDCYFEPEDEDDIFVPIGYECKEGIYTITASNWAVNGRRGGDGASGTVTPGPRTTGTATYQAPGAVPRANPVAVSVEYSGLDPADRGLIVSNITVIDPSAPCAALRSVEEWNGTLGLSYAFHARRLDRGEITVSHLAGVSTRLKKVSEGEGGVSWIGPLTGMVSVNDRHVSYGEPPAPDIVTTVVGDGEPVLEEPLQENVHAYLNLNLTDCSYNFGMVVGVRATATRTNRPPAEGTERLGSVRSDERPAGGSTTLSGRGDFEVRSTLWAGLNGGDVYVPLGLASAIFFDDFRRLDGMAETASVNWSFEPKPR